MPPARPDPRFWSGRRVLLTGHTGFKGAWVALLLSHLGARVFGYALAPEPGPALFPLLAPKLALENTLADIRDPDAVSNTVRTVRPSVVLHLAGQSLVPRAYTDPVSTFATNLFGTLHLLQAMRRAPGIEAAVLITTDKVYRNAGDGRRFREDDPLGGDDPYSASKAATEIAVASWRTSFRNELPPLATARAGNVIGGGDFAAHRIVPDIVRTLGGEAPLQLRYPDATRPWLHVLDVLCGYLLLAERLVQAPATCPPALNFALPDPTETSVLALIAAFEQAFGQTLDWRQVTDAPPEAPRLALDPGLAMETLSWQPQQDRAAAIRATAAWYAAWRRGEDVSALCDQAAAEALA